jgi:hypothetical protein
MENYTRKEVSDTGHVYYFNAKNQRHRLNGPAVEGPSGFKTWWVNGKPHRVDGPAVIYTNGTKFWWVNGKRYSKSCHNRLYLFSVLEPRRIGLISMKEG